MTHHSTQGLLLLTAFFCYPLSGLCEHPGPLQYSRDVFLLLRHSGAGNVDHLATFPAEIIHSEHPSGN